MEPSTLNNPLSIDKSAKLEEDLTVSGTLMKRIRVILVDDHTFVREGFRKMLELESDIEVVAEADNGRNAIALAKKHRPDVVLMDIAMPHLNGLEATRQLLKALPKTKVLILSAYSDDAYVQNAYDSGAAGFLLKQTSLHDAYRAIRSVGKGGTFFSPPISKRMTQIRSQRAPGSAKGKKIAGQLTSRELEVLQLIAEGKANKETAHELGISIKTVEKHREHLMKKLDIHDIAGITRYAIEAGIIESSARLNSV